ncbi:MAG TPA: Crp/Fnr family transcriptional regulator [bacterium]|nr:Crp/Fnr family transcriptional regulator [bacterium]
MPDRLLQAFPFLRDVPPRSLEELRGQAVHRSLAHKEILVRDGRECAYLPFVLQGALRVYKASDTGKELTFYRIEKGESCILTTTCILSGGIFPAIAEAEGATEVLLVPSKMLLRLVDESPHWRRFVFSQFTQRLTSALTLVEEVAFRHVDDRLAAFLVRAAGAGSTVRRTHGGLADELGTSREVVSRILKDFESAGIVTISRGSIRILDRPALEGRAAASPPV